MNESEAPEISLISSLFFIFYLFLYLVSIGLSFLLFFTLLLFLSSAHWFQTLFFVSFPLVRVWVCESAQSEAVWGGNSAKVNDCDYHTTSCPRPFQKEPNQPPRWTDVEQWTARVEIFENGRMDWQSRHKETRLRKKLTSSE